MSIKLIVDSGCDMHPSFFKKFGVESLPGIIRTKDKSGTVQEFLDTRNDDFTRLLYQQHSFDKSKFIETDIPSVDQLADMLREKVKGHDQAIIQIISRTTSPAYESINSAASQLTDVCNIKVIDTKTAFTGQGLIAAFTQIMINNYKKADKELDVSTLRRKVEEFIQTVYTYVVPSSVAYLYERAKKKRVDTNISWFAAKVANIGDVVPVVQFRLDIQESIDKARKQENAIKKVVDNIIQRIDGDQLKFPFINISIADYDVELLSKMEHIVRLEKHCEKKDVKVFKSRMSNAGAINIGPGSVSFSCAAANHIFGN